MIGGRYNKNEEVKPKKQGKVAISHPTLLLQILSGFRDPADEKGRAYTAQDYRNLGAGIFAKIPPKELFDQLAKGYALLQTDEQKTLFLYNAKALITNVIRADVNQEFQADIIAGMTKFLTGVSPVLANDFVTISKEFDSANRTKKNLDSVLTQSKAASESTSYTRSPASLANDLKIHNLSNFAQLKLSHYYNKNWEKNKQNPNFAINTITADFNKLIYMVQTDILSASNKEEQKERFKFYVDVLEECLKQGDYMSAQAINAGLGKMERLKYIADESPAVFEKFKKLSAIVTEDRSKKLIDLMDKRTKKGEAVVPPSNLLNTIVTFIEDGNPNKKKYSDKDEKEGKKDAQKGEVKRVKFETEKDNEEKILMSGREFLKHISQAQTALASSAGLTQLTDFEKRFAAEPMLAEDAREEIYDRAQANIRVRGTELLINENPKFTPDLFQQLVVRAQNIAAQSPPQPSAAAAPLPQSPAATVSPPPPRSVAAVAPLEQPRQVPQSREQHLVSSGDKIQKIQRDIINVAKTGQVEDVAEFRQNCVAAKAMLENMLSTYDQLSGRIAGGPLVIDEDRAKYTGQLAAVEKVLKKLDKGAIKQVEIEPIAPLDPNDKGKGPAQKQNDMKSESEETKHSEKKRIRKEKHKRKIKVKRAAHQPIAKPPEAPSVAAGPVTNASNINSAANTVVSNEPSLIDAVYAELEKNGEIAKMEAAAKISRKELANEIKAHLAPNKIFEKVGPQVIVDKHGNALIAFKAEKDPKAKAFNEALRVMGIDCTEPKVVHGQDLQVIAVNAQQLLALVKDENGANLLKGQYQRIMRDKGAEDLLSPRVNQTNSQVPPPVAPRPSLAATLPPVTLPAASAIQAAVAEKLTQAQGQRTTGSIDFRTPVVGAGMLVARQGRLMGVKPETEKRSVQEIRESFLKYNQAAQSQSAPSNKTVDLPIRSGIVRERAQTFKVEESDASALKSTKKNGPKV